MKKSLEILATTALFAIYILYRIAHFFRLTSKIKSFKDFVMVKPIDKWQHRMYMNEAIWTVTFYASIALVYFIGWFWTLILSASVVLINLIIFVIFRKKQDDDRVY